MGHVKSKKQPPPLNPTPTSIHHTFSEERLTTDMSLREFQTRKIKKDGKEIEVQLFHPRFRTRHLYTYRGSGIYGILICFDVTNRQNFSNLTKWIVEIERYKEEDCLVIVVGCKADYLASPPPNSFNPFVPTKSIQQKLYHNLPIWYQDSIICSSDFISHLSPLLTHTHIMKLRLVCKWLYNITLDSLNINIIENKSQVTKEEVKNFCDAKGLDVVYTSSKYGVGVDEMLSNFAIMAHDVMNDLI